MPTAEIEEFAAKLVKTVRDRAIQAGDALLLPQFTSGRARRRQQLPREEIERIVAETVDETIFYLLDAIDNELIQLRYVTDAGKVVDLYDEGLSELKGWYLGDDGWRSKHSEERVFDVLERDGDAGNGKEEP